MSPDPLLNSGRPDNPQSWNRYGYALNNPLRYTDPTGLYVWDESLGGSATDKELKKNAGKDKAAKASAKQIISQRNAIRSALSQMAGSKIGSLTNAASPIGAENAANGVTISMGSVTPGASAQVGNTLPLTLDEKGNPVLDLTTRPGASGANLFIDLSHEGTHIFDAQGVADGETGSMLHIMTEIHGYSTSIDAARYLGWQSIGPSGGSPFWNSSWSAADQQTRPVGEIFNFLQHSALYQNSNWHVAYEKP